MKPLQCDEIKRFIGADGQGRTDDLLITNHCAKNIIHDDQAVCATETKHLSIDSPDSSSLNITIEKTHADQRQSSVRHNSVPVDFQSLPKLMSNLPRDHRGYPVPWFVDWIDGKPEFRAMDGRKYVRAVRDKLCWVCGNPLKGTYVFVAGPMCGINRTSSEPPCHPECARWSARNCPFLSNPNMVRREDDVINNVVSRDKAPGIMITRNPGVTLLWFTREYEVLKDGRGNPLITMGRPSGVEWFCRGRAATREEVEESIDSGLPALEAMARTQEGALEDLYRKRKAFERWLPNIRKMPC